MLSPEYIDHLPDRVVELYADLEIRILEDMARRILKTGALTETAQWQMWRLEQIGAEREFIRYHLQRLTGKTQGEINELLAEAGEKALYYDDQIYRAAGLSPKALRDSEALQKIIKAGSDKTMRLFENLTSTTADTASRQFENALDAAYMDITSGAFSYQDAVRSAVKSLSKAGIDAIIYPSGHTDKMDVAVRRAVLTGVNQTTARMQIARADEMECDLVETTAHMGARPEHMDWQGRIFSRSGKSRKYPDFVKSTGYGTGPGLCGWNCRHNFYPFYPGVSVRNYTDERLAELDARNIPYGGGLYTKYEITQMQRALERRVRKYKRRYLAETAAGVDAGQSAAKLKAARQQLSAFLAETGEQMDGARTEVPGFGRREAKQADAAASALQSAQNNATLKESNQDYKEITAQSIQRIQPFACETLDAAGSRALANAHKKLLLEARKVPLGVEKARCYGLDMQPLGGYKESSEPGTSVKIKVPNVDCIVMHSHPSGLTFSPDDLRAFAKHTSLKLLTAVGNDGNIFAIERTANTNEIALQLAASELSDAADKAKTNEQVWNLMNAFFEEVQQYGVHYYAGKD